MSNEDEYFKKIELEKQAKLRQKLEKENASAALEERQKLHWHRCGKCGAAMDTHTFRGVEIEICSECGAVLLDNGELETLAGKDQSGMFSGIASLFGGS